ncbi:MAG: GAF domain-containing protein [Anaerolineae bacterium]|nr:GAF domain-containing protein [Anaerolineae bacterium]
MRRLSENALNDLTEVLDQAAYVCDRARFAADVAGLLRTLYGTRHLLDAVLEVLRDEMTSTSQESLAFLAMTTREWISNPDSESRFLDLLQHAKIHIHAEAISLFTLVPERGVLVLKHAVGDVSEQVIGIEMPLGLGVVGWVAQYNEDLIVPSTSLDERFFSGVDAQTGFVTRSILCVPVVCAGNVIGAVEVLNKVGGSFNDEDVGVLRQAAALMVDPGL